MPSSARSSIRLFPVPLVRASLASSAPPAATNAASVWPSMVQLKLQPVCPLTDADPGRFLPGRQEGANPRGDVPVDECARRADRLEAAVEHVHAAIVEIGRVEAITAPRAPSQMQPPATRRGADAR